MKKQKDQGTLQPIYNIVNDNHFIMMYHNNPQGTIKPKQAQPGVPHSETQVQLDSGSKNLLSKNVGFKSDVQKKFVPKKFRSKHKFVAHWALKNLGLKNFGSKKIWAQKNSSPNLTCPDLTCPYLNCPDLTCPDLTCLYSTCTDLTCPILTCIDLTCPILTFDFSSKELLNLLSQEINFFWNPVKHLTYAQKQPYRYRFSTESIQSLKLLKYFSFNCKIPIKYPLNTTNKSFRDILIIQTPSRHLPDNFQASFNT